MKLVLIFNLAFCLLPCSWAQTILDAPGLAAFGTNTPAGGGGGDINTSLTHHYKFDENTGTTTADAVGGGSFLGTFHGSGVTTWGAAKVGVSSVNFNGGGAGVTLGSTITTGTTCTYAFWVFPTSDANNSYQAIFSQDGNHALYLIGQGSGVLKVDFYYGGDHKSTGTFTTNAWHHIVVVNNGGSGSVYIDGTLDAATFISVPSLDVVGLGSDNGTGSEPLAGNLDEALLYSRVLAPADITALFNSTTGPTP